MESDHFSNNRFSVFTTLYPSLNFHLSNPQRTIPTMDQKSRHSFLICIKIMPNQKKRDNFRFKYNGINDLRKILFEKRMGNVCNFN